MVFSHELIHEIGGEDDTNRNTTRRLLLLLESRVLGREDAYQRVVRNILNRYLLEDRGLWKGSGHRVPRFLQNDFARYWRTMAVGFAYKLRKRAGKGWTIRNIKLRMSRKWIYVSGLLACYRCHLDYSPQDQKVIFGDPDRHKEVVEYGSRLPRDPARYRCWCPSALRTPGRSRKEDLRYLQRVPWFFSGRSESWAP
jgi:hypothetical protein